MTKTMWVFGYGSLIWNPEFPVAERRIARVTGWQRSFCMRSIHHRGSVAQPGLVLALDASPEGRCDGVAFRVMQGHEETTLAALRERELISSAYLETRIPAELEDGSVVEALCYVIDRDHDQYCGGMSLEEQARIIAHAIGGRGSNRDYLWATAGHLAELGIEDRDLTDLAAKVRTLCR